MEPGCGAKGALANRERRCAQREMPSTPWTSLPGLAEPVKSYELRERRAQNDRRRHGTSCRLRRCRSRQWRRKACPIARLGSVYICRTAPSARTCIERSRSSVSRRVPSSWPLSPKADRGTWFAVQRGPLLRHRLPQCERSLRLPGGEFWHWNNGDSNLNPGNRRVLPVLYVGDGVEMPPCIGWAGIRGWSAGLDVRASRSGSAN
jgi:hypothetical protein